jgi:DNA-binding CsgD family transcriptional regulator
MLLGRQRDSEVLDGLVAAARGARGGAIVVHGEPGIGKTALLGYATEAAAGFHILCTAGSDAEIELPFAALQRLCAPALANVDLLPEPQRDALGTAFGRVTGGTPDRLLVGLAVLSLLSGLAADQPVLCVIDDAQCLDTASAQAMAFVARRLASERIVFLFAARTVPGELEGLPEWAVEGLSEGFARALLRSVLPDRVDERVEDRVLEEAHGNPLALLELPRGLMPAQLAGGFAAPVAVPLTGRIEASFRRRFAKLPMASRRLLLVAAADPTGDPVLVWRAADLLEVPASAAAPAEAEGLVDLHPRIVFRHPLVRSAVYRATTPKERREAHRALAEATDAALDPDRRAWHRGQAATRPDDDVAMELEMCAVRARSRGGFAAAAAFMERSAELATDPAQRARRALAAGEAKRQAGALDAALRLAATAERGPLDEFQRAEVDVLRAQVSFASDRGADAPLLLFRAAERLEALDTGRARETYLDALVAAMFAGRLGSGSAVLQIAQAALAAPRASGGPRASDLLLEGFAWLVTGDYASGTSTLQDAVGTFKDLAAGTDEAIRWSWLAGRAAAMIWDYDSWDVLTALQVRAAREAGALSVLPVTLSIRASVHLFAGELSVVASLIEQAEALADAIDNRAVRNAAVAAAAFQGREHEALEVIEANAKDFVARGEGMGLTMTLWAKAVLFNGLGRYEDAFAAAEEALADPDDLCFSPLAAVELIEAGSRTGRQDAAAVAYERLAKSTAPTGTPWAGAIEARSRALLSDRTGAEALFRDAIDLLTQTPLRVDLARTHLLYGEWLRRERRHVQAREQLRLAQILFSDFGMEGFAERARLELRASGQRARGRKYESGNELTTQEAEISRLVGEGATNHEIATQLFISQSTVEYHLHNVFRKLGVTSRTQLARRVLQMGPATTPEDRRSGGT